MKIIKCDRNTGAVRPPKSPKVRKSQSLQDEKFEERLRMAERLVQALREAGYTCVQGEDGHERAFKRLD